MFESLSLYIYIYIYMCSALAFEAIELLFPIIKTITYYLLLPSIFTAIGYQYCYNYSYCCRSRSTSFLYIACAAPWPSRC